MKIKSAISLGNTINSDILLTGIEASALHTLSKSNPINLLFLTFLIHNLKVWFHYWGVVIKFSQR